MPCLLALIGFFCPRIVLIILWLSGYLDKAYATALVVSAGGAASSPPTRRAAFSCAKCRASARRASGRE